MATIFLSYSSRDEGLAKQIEARLQSKGHVFSIGVGTPAIGQWRAKLLNALRASDVVIPFLSQHGLQSDFVISEIGAARAFGETKGMLLVPIIINDSFFVPSFVADYHCFHLVPGDAQAIDALVDEISNAITRHVDEIPKSPRIFISHRHKDEAIAEALVELLEAAFSIEKEDIRCTSVQPYTLPSGEKTSDKLRSEISKAKVVIGLLTPDTKESNYVVAELGAAWGCEIPTFPLLARGATYEHVPEPLNERHSLSLQKETDCMQLLDDLARETSLKRKSGVDGRVMKEVKTLCEVAGKTQ